MKIIKSQNKSQIKSKISHEWKKNTKVVKLGTRISALACSKEKFHQKLLFDINAFSLSILPIVAWRMLVSIISIMLLNLITKGLWIRRGICMCAGNLWKSISHSIPTSRIPFCPPQSWFPISQDQRPSNSDRNGRNIYWHDRFNGFRIYRIRQNL